MNFNVISKVSCHLICYQNKIKSQLCVESTYSMRKLVIWLVITYIYIYMSPHAVQSLYLPGWLHVPKGQWQQSCQMKVTSPYLSYACVFTQYSSYDASTLPLAFNFLSASQPFRRRTVMMWRHSKCKHQLKTHVITRDKTRNTMFW